MISEKRCVICARLMEPKRAKSYPHSKTCGKRECSTENKKRVHNILAHSIKQRRRNLQTVREATAYTSKPFDAVIWAIRRSAEGALVRAARAFGVAW